MGFVRVLATNEIDVGVFHDQGSPYTLWRRPVRARRLWGARTPCRWIWVAGGGLLGRRSTPRTWALEAWCTTCVPQGRGTRRCTCNHHSRITGSTDNSRPTSAEIERSTYMLRSTTIVIYNGRCIKIKHEKFRFYNYYNNGSFGWRSTLMYINPDIGNQL